MDDFRRLGMSCTHCGGELAAKRIFDGSVQIKGLHKLQYLHVGTGERSCTIKREAAPYDGWQASAAYDAADTPKGDVN